MIILSASYTKEPISIVYRKKRHIRQKRFFIKFIAKTRTQKYYIQSITNVVTPTGQIIYSIILLP